MGKGCNEQCDDGTFGDGCQLKCHCADDLQCRHIDGKCLDGKCARRNNHVKEPSGNYIPMETSILQESNQEILTDGDILAEDVYDDNVVLTKENFLSYVQQVKMKADPFSNEFSCLDKHVKYPCKTGKSVENICKNRCKAILPYANQWMFLFLDDHSRVVLHRTIEDFWRMIWLKEKCNTIVMLTEIMENGKYSVREKRFVHHFQCTIWPDHGVLSFFIVLSFFHPFFLSSIRSFFLPSVLSFFHPFFLSSIRSFFLPSVLSFFHPFFLSSISFFFLFLSFVFSFLPSFFLFHFFFFFFFFFFPFFFLFSSLSLFFFHFSFLFFFFFFSFSFLSLSFTFFSFLFFPFLFSFFSLFFLFFLFSFLFLFLFVFSFFLFFYFLSFLLFLSFFSFSFSFLLFLSFFVFFSLFLFLHSRFSY
ncbi:unnamed protein product [Acanthosepion pharaonis]|uniref:Tyrosine-protein phosphatase domain-containing protein n=1 Tax=Acanthosepion pharaonis TaxID=158019 RepID=A0A812BMI8_ACAPH|nr:unnamed protein product [Sepia pharaonis]